VSEELQGRTALVTGGAKRLGRATAVALAEAGVNVVVHYNRSEAEAREVAGELEGLGVRAWAVQADLRHEQQVRMLMTEARRFAGPLHVLVNCASSFPASQFADFSRDELQESIDVNAWAPLAAARCFVEQAEAGTIVNFLDTRVVGYDWQHVAYHAAKTLFELFTREMALRWAPRFRVNAVAPGLILAPEGQGAEYLERLKGGVPLARVGGPRDVTEAVLYLLRSSYLTGQVIYVDGGRHLMEAKRG
jgi:hypothetical protein